MEPKKLSPSKINPTKLLGGTSFVKNTTNISEKLKEESITISKSDLSTIKGQVFGIKNLVTSLTTLKRKKLKTERAETEREKFGEREKELEKKKKPEDNKIKLPQAPKLGFLDIVRRFVVNTLIGFAVVRLIKHLPKLIEVAKFIGGAMDFITNVGGNLLNGLATFVQKGYEAYDFTRNTLKSFGGDNALKLFDGFNNALEGIVTAALAASFALFDMAGGGDNRDVEPKVRGGKPKVTTSGGRRVGGIDIRNQLRQTTKITTSGGKKAVLSSVRPFTKRLPIIGALLDFGLSVALGEDPGRAAFKAIGAGLLGSLGAAVGSVVPIAGNLLGGLIGGVAGDAIGGALYDMFFGNKKPSEQKVAKAAGGGQPVTRAGKVVSGPRRTITKSKVKRTISVQPTQLKPGADIGGEKNIEKVFPKSKDKSQVSPLGYIEESYKNTAQDRLFGPLLNLQTKSIVGQKPNKVDYFNAAQGLSNWMTLTFSDEILRTGAVYAAGGGEINADMLSKKSGDMTDAIAKSLEDSISKRMDDNIQDLMKQMMLKGIEPKTEEKEGTGQPLTPEGIPLGEGETASGRALMSGLIQRGFTKEEAAAIVGNLWAESGFRTTATNPTSGAFGLMQWLGGRKSRLYSYAAEQGKQVTDVNLQLDYIKWELKGGNSYETAQFKKAMAYGSSVADKTRGFAYEVERASTRELSSSMSKRVGAAESVYGGRMVTGEKVPSTFQGPLGSIVSIPGLKDQQGRPVQFASPAANAFKKMMDDASKQGVIFNRYDIASTFRTPEYNRRVGGATNSLHTKGLAGDIHGVTGSWIRRYGSKYGWYPNDYPGSHGGHYEFRGARFHGGLISQEGKYNLHKGEYVVDKDSVDLFGKSFIATINDIENKTQLKQKAGSLIDHLSYIADYEPGGQQEIEVEIPEPQVVSVPMMVPIAGGTTVIAGSSYNPDDTQALYAQG